MAFRPGGAERLKKHDVESSDGEDGRQVDQHVDDPRPALERSVSRLDLRAWPGRTRQPTARRRPSGRASRRQPSRRAGWSGRVPAPHPYRPRGEGRCRARPGRAAPLSEASTAAATILARTGIRARVLRHLVRWTIEPVRQRPDHHDHRQREREEPEEDLHRQPTGNQAAGEGLVPAGRSRMPPHTGTSLSLGLQAVEGRVSSGRRIAP